MLTTFIRLNLNPRLETLFPFCTACRCGVLWNLIRTASLPACLLTAWVSEYEDYTFPVRIFCQKRFTEQLRMALVDPSSLINSICRFSASLISCYLSPQLFLKWSSLVSSFEFLKCFPNFLFFTNPFSGLLFLVWSGRRD